MEALHIIAMYEDILYKIIESLLACLSFRECL